MLGACIQVVSNSQDVLQHFNKGFTRVKLTTGLPSQLQDLVE